LPTSFSELTITTFSKTYDSYTRSYKKAPQLLAEVGGVINSMYLMALILNYYTEKKLKEADIFNMCCSKGNDHKNQSEEKGTESFQKITNPRNVSIINNLSNLGNQNNKFNENSIFNQEKDIESNPKTKSMDTENNKVIKNNYFQNKSPEKTSSKGIVRFKSIIFDKSASLDILLDVEYSYLEILCPFRRKPIQKEKMNLAEKFCDQLFDINFLFANVLDTQINFKNYFENAKS
jgi:hypothetical protein